MRGMGTHLIEKKELSAKGLLTKVRYLFKKISEPQKDPRGLKPKISLVDCLMSALAIFGLKFSSLLHFDEQRTTDIIKHNLKTLYEVEETPLYNLDQLKRSIYIFCYKVHFITIFC